jgi:Zn-dependent peptidase ImmA (M78 family)
VWPEWWTSEAEFSPSARAELRYTVARRLGLSPASLFDDTPRFLWRDASKFKNRGTQSETELAILTCYGVAVGRCLVDALPPAPSSPTTLSASELRRSILESHEVVDLLSLVATCWALGWPVIHLELFPLAQKRMHAMSVRVDDRYAVLVGRRSKFPAQIAFAIAHEIGHVMLGHVAGSVALFDAEDPLLRTEVDDEERGADEFALELLTGQAAPEVTASTQSYTATQLAAAAQVAAADLAIDPAILALCLGHATGRWRQTFGALKLIPPGEIPTGEVVNEIARTQLEWETLAVGSRDFLSKVMGR